MSEERAFARCKTWIQYEDEGGKVHDIQVCVGLWIGEEAIEIADDSVDDPKEVFIWKGFDSFEEAERFMKEDVRERLKEAVHGLALEGKINIHSWKTDQTIKVEVNNE